MTRLRLIISLFVLLTIHATAQQTDNKTAETPQARTRKAVSKLNLAVALNTEQINQAKVIFLNFYTKREAIKGNTKLKENQKQSKLKELKDERNKKLKALLTPDQWKKWQAFKDEKKAVKRK